MRDPQSYFLFVKKQGTKTIFTPLFYNMPTKLIYFNRKTK